MKKGEQVFLGACVNYAREELKKGVPGFHIELLIGWLRGLSAQIRVGSVVKNGSRVVFADILQGKMGVRHFNLSNGEDSSDLANELDKRVDQIQSGEDSASIGTFLDILCDAANKAYDRGCLLFIEI